MTGKEEMSLLNAVSEMHREVKTLHEKIDRMEFKESVNIFKGKDESSDKDLVEIAEVKAVIENETKEKVKKEVEKTDTKKDKKVTKK